MSNQLMPPELVLIAARQTCKCAHVIFLYATVCICRFNTGLPACSQQFPACQGLGFSTEHTRAAWPLVARTLLALVIPCEQVGNAYVVELVQRQQQSGFGIDPQFEVNSSMMVAACGSSVSSSMQLCVSSGA